MASSNKHQDYVEQLAKGIHIWSSHTFKAAQAEHDKLVKALDKLKAQFRIAED